MIADTAPVASKGTGDDPLRQTRPDQEVTKVNPTQVKILANHWNRVCQVNLWHAVDGRMVAESQAARERSEFHQRVWKGAEELAEKEGHGVGPMDLRNSACLLTIDAVKAPADMSLAEFTRLMTFYSLLIDPEDENALAKWRA